VSFGQAKLDPADAAAFQGHGAEDIARGNFYAPHFSRLLNTAAFGKQDQLTFNQ
jgi:hypothetical protein